MDRNTKIVATIGPVSQDKNTISKLIQAGVNVTRLNFSHGNHRLHAAVIKRVREVAHHLGQPVTILQDLQGPKIRIGELASGSVRLVPNQTFTLTTQTVPGDEHIVSVDFPDLPRSLKPGCRIMLDDGKLELKVCSVGQTHVETRVILGGTLKPHKGVNLPGTTLDIPSFTEKDKVDLAFGMQHGVDAVAVSFVRSAEDVTRVRQAIDQLAPERFMLPIIAKLERPEALDNLVDIVQTADGVMVARGDLGVEMSPEEVPIAQKRIIQTANQHSKVVITATQMLDSMIHNPRPTRAEASDVANAIFDGTDAVMLSGETAVGKYPLQAVEMMNAIISQAEPNMTDWGHWVGMTTPTDTQDDAYFMTLAARELAHDRNVAAIAVFTKSGRTALLMSKTRPGVPILAFTPDINTYRRLALYWGVTGKLVPHVDSLENMLKVVEEAMVTSTPIRPGQQVVIICGYPVDQPSPTNMAILHTVGDSFSP